MEKGRKERICPLWTETAGLMGELPRRSPRGPDEPTFTNRSGQALGAWGMRLPLRQQGPLPSDCIRTSARSASRRTLSGTRLRFSL
jgi:hypothetical protein